MGGQTRRAAWLGTLPLPLRNKVAIDQKKTPAANGDGGAGETWCAARKDLPPSRTPYAVLYCDERRGSVSTSASPSPCKTANTGRIRKGQQRHNTCATAPSPWARIQ